MSGWQAGALVNLLGGNYAIKFRHCKPYGKAVEEAKEQESKKETGKPVDRNSVGGIEGCEMKLLAFMNGWSDAPHCWMYYLINPIRYERTQAWVMVSVFGLVFFLG